MENTPLDGGSALCEQDAWDIAMAWQPQLQGKVRLVVDHDGPIDSIIKSYAWVRIDDPRLLEKSGPDEAQRCEVVSILRAVMVTWSALAACPGFSGSENGQFWKRVVSELQDNPPEPPRTKPFRGCMIGGRDVPPAVTDANGFFALPGITFPRFMVEMPYELDEAFERLFTRDGPELVRDVRTKMDALLARLRPCGQNAPTQVVDICLRAQGFYGENCGRTLAEIVGTTHEHVGDARDSGFRISHIEFRDGIQFGDRERIDTFVNLVRATSFTMNNVHLSPLLNSLTPDDRAMWLESFLGLDDVKGKVTSFEFPRHYVNNAVFRALMTSLPFASTVGSMTFGTEYSGRKGLFQQVDMPWIGYAIFHPQARASSFRHLTIDRITITEHSKLVLTAMARGNNVLQLLTGTPTDCDAYYSAQLAGGTIVRLKATPTSEVLFTASSTGARVDVCGVNSLDVTTWGEWVAVLIPAYGLGWVRRYELLDARAHSPSKGGLTGLCLRRMYNNRDGPADDLPEVLLHILPPLGPSLQYLDISSYTNISSTTLEAILRACPALKVLIVSHDGSLWSEPLSDIAPLVTQLEELELSVYYNHTHVKTPTLDHLQTSLRNLRTLRLRVYDMQVDQLQASQETIQQFLRHLPTLRYFHWRNAGADYTWKGSKGTIPYEHSRQWTPRALTQLDLDDDTYLYSDGPFHPGCAAAFLSVVQHESESVVSALGRIVDRGVLTSIFQFATSPVKRFIHIEPNNKSHTGAGATNEVV